MRSLNIPDNSLETMANMAFKSLEVSIAGFNQGRFRDVRKLAGLLSDEYDTAFRNALLPYSPDSGPLIMERGSAKRLKLDKYFLHYAIGSFAANVLKSVNDRTSPQPAPDDSGVLMASILRDGSSYMRIAGLAQQLSDAHRFDLILDALNYINNNINE